MRWRILPALDLAEIAQTRCLLLGQAPSGVRRAYTHGWGIRKITLVDSGRVSFSNPVRQPLFEFDDCLHGGRPKAEAATERLKRISPGVDARGVTLSILMPGRPIPPGSEEQAKADVNTLEGLFDGHDAIILLMDSCESRWLPTVLGSAKGKIFLNAALGLIRTLLCGMVRGTSLRIVRTDLAVTVATISLLPQTYRPHTGSDVHSDASRTRANRVCDSERTRVTRHFRFQGLWVRPAGVQWRFFAVRERLSRQEVE
ncbi:hypothetical protein BJV74DRAFT_285880 [Russula compacta]|nr:hypothetical protein BJV74DRAFT_285880 [Russula compacta]